MFTDRPSLWQSLPASTAAVMPPSLISFSDTPDGAGLGARHDIGERMDRLVDADRHLGARVRVSSGRRSRHRRAAARRTSASPCGSARHICARRRASARNWRRRRAASSAALRAPQTRSRFPSPAASRRSSSLKKSKPSFCRTMRLGDVLLGGLVAKEPHRLHRLAARLARPDRSGACRDARPIRSSTAISTAECAPPLPSSARCNAGRSAGHCRGVLPDQIAARDNRARRRSARRACRRSWSARRRPRPSRRCRRRPRSGPGCSARR